MTFFRFKHKISLNKQAGSTIGEDPSRWGSEVMKSIAATHPYVDMSQSEIKFAQADPAKGSASGWVDIEGKVALAFSIRRDERTDDIKLDPIDVMFDGKKMRSLRESAYVSAISGDSAGEIFPKGRKGDEYGQPAPKNQYVGHLTGDATPLNIVPTPGGYGAAGMGKTSSLLAARAVRRPNAMDDWNHILTGYPHLASAAQAYGVAPTLASLRPDSSMRRITKSSDVVMITKGPGVTFMVHTPDGQEFSMSGRDLRSALADDADEKITQIMKRGWVVISNLPAMMSVEAPLPGNNYSMVKSPGCYMIKCDCPRAAVVSTHIMSFDGQQQRLTKAITSDNMEYVGQSVMGLEIEPEPRWVPVTSQPEIGDVGCFLIGQAGFPAFTHTVKVESIIGSPVGYPRYIVRRMDTLKRSALIPTENIISPRRADAPDDGFDIVRGSSYFIPTEWSWIKIHGKVDMTDPAKNQRLREALVVTRPGNAGWLMSSSSGTEEAPSVDAVRMKLASLGANDHAIEVASSLKQGQSVTIVGEMNKQASMKLDLKRPEPIRGFDREIAMIKSAASEVAEGADAAIASGADPDGHALDAILSMQFINDENLVEIIERSDMFVDCEDKIARLLLAARMGEESLDDMALARALRGLGSVGESISELEVNLRERGAI